MANPERYDEEKEQIKRGFKEMKITLKNGNFVVIKFDNFYSYRDFAIFTEELKRWFKFLSSIEDEEGAKAIKKTGLKYRKRLWKSTRERMIRVIRLKYFGSMEDRAKFAEKVGYKWYTISAAAADEIPKKGIKPEEIDESWATFPKIPKKSNRESFEPTNKELIKEEIKKMIETGNEY